MKILFRIVAPVAAFFLAFAAIYGFYRSRAPILMITDPSLVFLYGESRARNKEARISLELFRPFVPVLVAASAGPEVVAEAVKSVPKPPFVVFFPYHFMEAARRVRDEAPKTPVVVLRGRQEGEAEEGIAFVNVDTAADYYRAASSAAFLAGNIGNILVFHDSILQDSHREAFEKALEDEGFLGKPIYLGAGSDYYTYQEITCAVLAGPALRFFERNLKIPAVLFSWTDPEMTPSNVKVLFDDSPWALAAAWLKTFKAGSPLESLVLPSEPIVPSGRLEGKENAAELTAQAHKRRDP